MSVPAVQCRVFYDAAPPNDSNYLRIQNQRLRAHFVRQEVPYYAIKRKRQKELYILLYIVKFNALPPR